MAELEKIVVNQQLKKNRITILLIFALSVIPFAIAAYLAQHPQNVRTGTNKGQLITPPLALDYAAFSGRDAFSQQNLGELSGHWVLITIASDCDASCSEALDKANRIGLMMGKDIVRIRRAVLATGASLSLPAEWQNDQRLLKIALSEPALGSLKQSISNPANGELWLMDPFGNIMMRYPAGYDPYHVRDDLSKLLRISQIG